MSLLSVVIASLSLSLFFFSLSSSQYVTVYEERRCYEGMIRNLRRVNSSVILQALAGSTVRAAIHDTMDVLTEHGPFSRDFLFRQVTRTVDSRLRRDATWHDCRL